MADAYNVAMAAKIVQVYDSEMRVRPPIEFGQRIERIDGIVRTRGRYNMIVFSQLNVTDVDRVVAKQVEFFTGLGEDVEWKLYAHDLPPNLSASLAAHGFEPGDVETLMVLNLASNQIRAEVAPVVDVRTVSTPRDVATYVDVTTGIFGKDTKSSISDFELRLLREGADTIAVVGYVEGKPAAAAASNFRAADRSPACGPAGQIRHYGSAASTERSSPSAPAWRAIEAINT